jgi:hypothetical protein
MATSDPERYLAVLKASYDYSPQSDDEIEIKEGQILFLVERTDDECVPAIYLVLIPPSSFPQLVEGQDQGLFTGCRNTSWSRPCSICRAGRS